MDRVVLALRTFFSVALPYFRSEDRWAGRLLLPGIVAGELALVYLAVLIANWNASFFNALEARNWDAFSRQLIVFCLIVLGAAAITASNYFCGQTLQIRWRRWLTANYVSSWMAEGQALSRALRRARGRQYPSAHRERRLSLHPAHA